MIYRGLTTRKMQDKEEKQQKEKEEEGSNDSESLRVLPGRGLTSEGKVESLNNKEETTFEFKVV